MIFITFYPPTLWVLEQRVAAPRWITIMMGKTGGCTLYTHLDITYHTLSCLGSSTQFKPWLDHGQLTKVLEIRVRLYSMSPEVETFQKKSQKWESTWSWRCWLCPCPAVLNWVCWGDSCVCEDIAYLVRNTKQILSQVLCQHLHHQHLTPSHTWNIIIYIYNI